MTARPTCATCPYWTGVVDVDGIDSHGECRRFPPRVEWPLKDGILTISAREELVWFATQFPRTSSDDEWCGEHPDLPAYIAATRKPMTRVFAIPREEVEAAIKAMRDDPTICEPLRPAPPATG